MIANWLMIPTQFLECESDVEKCLYDKKLANWHTQHESWQEQMYDWHNNMRLVSPERFYYYQEL